MNPHGTAAVLMKLKNHNDDEAALTCLRLALNYLSNHALTGADAAAYSRCLRIVDDDNDAEWNESAAYTVFYRASIIGWTAPTE